MFLHGRSILVIHPTFKELGWQLAPLG